MFGRAPDKNVSAFVSVVVIHGQVSITDNIYWKTYHVFGMQVGYMILTKLVVTTRIIRA
jgi:hypothetical protein